MIFLHLFYEFFKIGLFAIGGGQATIPFLYDLCYRYAWFSTKELVDIIAISESTPGPIGINMATYAGYNAAHFLGGIVATLALVLPSIVIITLISKALDKFKKNKYVVNTFTILRPSVVGLIASAGFTVFALAVLNLNGFKDSGNFLSLFRWKEITLFVVLFIVTLKWKKHPIVYLSMAMIVGMIFQF